MELIIILIVLIIFIIILRYLFNYNIKRIKHLAEEDEELDIISEKCPDNVDICKKCLKIVNNESVKIENDNNAKSSLYIAISNKIIIGNITKSYTRIQTIAHECLHSIQDKKILLFNFVFSNIYLLYFAIICILKFINFLSNEMLFIVIYLILSLVYYTIRVYLENDAMIKAKYLAKEYMEKEKILNKIEIDKLINGFDKINNIGIKCTNYKFFENIIIKLMFFIIICIIR